MKRFSFSILASFILGCWLAACTSHSPTGVYTATPEQMPMETFSSTPQASPDQTSTPTSTPVATLTTAPSATSTLTPTALPLDADGPWIVLEKENSDTGQQTYAVTGLSGMDWNRLKAPEITNHIGRWAVLPSPQNGYIAFVREQISGDQIPKLFENNEPGLYLTIVKLPENKPIRTIPLVGVKALEKIHQDVAAQVFPIGLSVLGNSKIFLWSPDGRYLAFASAVDGIQTDVSVYDTQTDAIQRLTQEKTGALPWSWSPDGKSLLYHQISGEGFDAMAGLPEFSAVYVYSFQTKSRYLYQVRLQEKIRWLTNSRFLVYDSLECTQCGENLREVDLNTGTARSLYPGVFNGPIIDRTSQSVLFNFSSNAYLNFEVDPGIYRLDLKTLQIKKVISGYFEIGFWSPELNLYVFYARPKNDFDQCTPIFLNEDGKELFRLPEAKYTPALRQALRPSPDGKWFYITNDKKSALYNIQGSLIKEFTREDMVWLRDSSGLVQVDSTNAQAVYLYEQNKNWEPRLVHALGEFADFSDIWVMYP